MTLTVDPADFAFSDVLAEGVRGKRVLVTGSGRDRGIGQAFALAAALNGADSVGIHFHRSYEDALETVEVWPEYDLFSQYE